MLSKISKKQKQVQGDKRNLEHDLSVATLFSARVLVDETRNKIVELPISKLLQELQSGNLTCVTVLKAYQAKASLKNNIYFITI